MNREYVTIEEAIKDITLIDESRIMEISEEVRLFLANHRNGGIETIKAFYDQFINRCNSINEAFAATAIFSYLTQ